MGTKVTLRHKPITNGRESLYLDFYPPIRCKATMKLVHKEYLGIYIYQNPQTEITFDKLPEAVGRLIDEVAQLRESIKRLGKPEPSASRHPIGIDEACAIVMKAKPTIYALVRRGRIPCCKIGKKLYFLRGRIAGVDSQR